MAHHDLALAAAFVGLQPLISQVVFHHNGPFDHGQLLGRLGKKYDLGLVGHYPFRFDRSGRLAAIPFQHVLANAVTLVRQHIVQSEATMGLDGLHMVGH